MTTAYWSSAQFHTVLAAFVADAAGEPTSLEPDRVRPWSTVWRAETARGVFWVKDNCLGQRHEAALLLRLRELAPDRVLPVTAADPASGLILTPDRGVPLGQQGEVDVDTWRAVVRHHAALQREVAPHVESLGLTRLTDDQLHAVEKALPDVALWSEQVAALGLPVTIDHIDLHPHNVFAVDGRLELFDFGDAVAMEPLASLRIPLASAVEPGLDPHRVADAGLEAWSDVTSVAELRAALPAALQLGVLARAESWRRCVADMADDELASFGGSASAWLAKLAGEPPLGTAPRAGNHPGGTRRLS